MILILRRLIRSQNSNWCTNSGNYLCNSGYYCQFNKDNSEKVHKSTRFHPEIFGQAWRPRCSSSVTYFVFVMHSWWDRRNSERDVISSIVKPVSSRMHNRNEESSHDLSLNQKLRLRFETRLCTIIWYKIELGPFKLSLWIPANSWMKSCHFSSRGSRHHSLSKKFKLGPNSWVFAENELSPPTPNARSTNAPSATLYHTTVHDQVSKHDLSLRFKLRSNEEPN